MPSVPPMDDARTTPRMTQQMMIMIFFCSATRESREWWSYSLNAAATYVRVNSLSLSHKARSEMSFPDRSSRDKHLRSRSQRPEIPFLNRQCGLNVLPKDTTPVRGQGLESATLHLQGECILTVPLPLLMFMSSWRTSLKAWDKTFYTCL